MLTESPWHTDLSFSTIAGEVTVDEAFVTQVRSCEVVMLIRHRIHHFGTGLDCFFFNVHFRRLRIVKYQNQTFWQGNLLKPPATAFS